MKRIIRAGAVATALAGLALALASVALAVKSGVWDGTTNQTYAGGAMPFSLEVAHNKVTVIYFGADFTGSAAGCANSDSPDAQRLDVNRGFRGFKIKHGKFGGKITVSGEQISFNAKFHGQALSGAFTDSYAVGNIHCSTGKVSFSAKPGNALT
jgi:hypothetical protein